MIELATIIALITQAMTQAIPFSLHIQGDGVYVFDGVQTTMIATPIPPPTTEPPQPNEFRVEDYGAKSGDSSDDTDAINKAIAAASSVSGKVLFQVDGQYNVSRPISIGEHVVVEGNGATLKLQNTAHLAEMLIIKGNNVHIDNLIVDGNNLTKFGITIQANIRDIKLTSSMVKNIKQVGAYSTDYVAGILIKTGTANILIDKNTISHVRAKNAPAISRGIAVSTYGGNVAQNVTISNNYISDIHPKDDGDGIWFDSSSTASNSVIIGNVIERSAKRGIKIQTPGIIVKDNHVINSFLNNNTYVAVDSVPNNDMFAGISVYADDVTIENNLIDGVGSYYAGIELGASELVRNIKLLNNTIRMGQGSNISGTSSIRIGDISGFEIRGNTINRAAIGVWTWESASGGTIASNIISGVNYGIQLSTYLAGKFVSDTVVRDNVIQASQTKIVNSSSNRNVTLINNR